MIRSLTPIDQVMQVDGKDISKVEDWREIDEFRDLQINNTEIGPLQVIRTIQKLTGNELHNKKTSNRIQKQTCQDKIIEGNKGDAFD